MSVSVRVPASSAAVVGCGAGGRSGTRAPYREVMTPISAVLFDLDGVIRHFDSAHTADVERRHGLDAGETFRVAFAPAVLDLVTTGRITRRARVAHVGAELDNAQAAEEWSGQPTRLDEGTPALVGELRAAGIRTAILRNGTDTIPAEVADMGIGEHFEAVFNSGEIGWMKPDVRAFQHVLDALELAPAGCSSPTTPRASSSERRSSGCRCTTSAR